MNAAAVPAAAWRLSSAMRAASQQGHDAAEQAPFLRALLRGALGKEAYGAYLARLHAVYAALEEAVRRQRRDPAITAVYDPALERLAAIEADLEFWSGGSPPASHSPAADAYRQRLKTIDSAAALLAHHYTRYLGDLSGGQAMGRALSRVFDLDGAGLAFYAFPSLPRGYKDEYRARLDALALQPAQIEVVLNEVGSAFRLNQALLDELGVEFDVSCSLNG